MTSPPDAPPTADDGFRTLFEFLPIGAYRSLPDGRQLRANPALVRLNGYDNEAEMLRSVADIAVEWYVDPHRRSEFRQALERDGHVRGFVSEIYRHKTRERIWISENAHAVRDAAGEVLFYEGTVEDVTEQRRASQAQQALIESEARWKLALDAVGDGVWDWDLVSGRETLSPRCREMHGLPDSASSHELLDAMTHPDDRAQMKSDREQHFLGLAPAYVNEHRVLGPDGQWRWVLSRGLVIQRDAEGRPLRMIGTHTDVTARRQAQALERERDAAEAATRAMTEFLSRLSHELRTPLNAILGFSQLMAGDRQTPPALQPWLREVLVAGRHLLALVEDVLDISGAQIGRLSMAMEPFALGPAVDECLAMLGAAARARALDVQSAGPEVTLRADRLRTKQIVSNLLSNAIKYNRDGGRIEVGWRVDDATVSLSVADSGHGIDPSQMGNLFRPFERLGAQRGAVEGTGLGLALSRQLARAMGGDILVDSRPGEGSTFTLRLPLSA